MGVELLASQDHKIFISHRHEDNRIASALRMQLQSWGVPEDSIFQSSSFKQSGKIGHSIKLEIQQFLEKAKLVILIYTYPEANWDYCMFECGLATNPGTAQTNVIVFQCTSSPPRVFRDELLINMDMEGIQRFTNQFHRKSDFFPGHEPFAPDLGDEGLHIRSNGLYEALLPLLPNQERRDDIRWGYFTLMLDPEIKAAIIDSGSFKSSYNTCVDLQSKIYVTSSFGFGLRHFGYQEFEPDLSLEKLHKRWYSNIESMQEDMNVPVESRWLDELNKEICRSVRNESPQLTWTSLKSAYAHIDWQVCPVVSEVRFKADGSVELMIFMYRVDSLIV